MIIITIVGHVSHASQAVLSLNLPIIPGQAIKYLTYYTENKLCEGIWGFKIINVIVYFSLYISLYRMKGGY